MKKQRRLSIGACYLIVLGVLIVASAAFALFYHGGGMPLVTAEEPTATPDNTAEPDQTPEQQISLRFAFRSGGKWGYKSESGEVVIEAQFAEVLPYYENRALAAVEQGGTLRYGVIDERGAWVVEPRYEQARPYSEGFAAVCENSKWGYLDLSGLAVVAPTYESAGDYCEGLARVSRGGKYGYLDTTGNLAIDCEYAEAAGFSEGLAFVAKEETGGKKYYLITSKNEVVAPLSVAASSTYSQSLAPVTISAGKVTYFTRRGKQAFDATFEEAGSFAEDLAPVKQGGKWGYINTSGQIVIQPQYAAASAFGEGLAAVQDENGKWGYVDRIGAVVIPFQYEAAEPFENGYALVRKAVEQGITDQNGNYKQLYLLEGSEQTLPGDTSGQDTQQTQQPQTTGTGTVKADSLNVRKEPSTSAEKAGSLKNGTRVEILGEEQDWYQIRYNDLTGYVKKEYITAENP